MNRLHFSPHALAVAILLMLAGGGCARSVSFSNWQKGVEDYVWTSAGGDPNRLRELSLGIPGSSHKGFALTAKDMPGESTDARGVLLGMKPVHGRPHMIFLVGLVKKHSVQDVRLAAMAFDGKDFAWVWGKANSAAVSQYRAARAAQWKQASGSDSGPPAAYKSFPGVDDVFKLNAEGEQISATHVQSGTTWTLTPPRSGQ